MVSSDVTLDSIRDMPTVGVPIAAGLLGISRGVAYEAARRYLETDGREGLAVLRFGHRLVVPVPQLLKLLGAAPEVNAPIEPQQ